MGGISPVGGIRNFTGGRVTGWREPEEEWFWWFEPFSMLKTAFHECWTSIKIKINMTCVLREYKIKTKMEQGQWLQLKCCFYWVITFNYKYIINITINNCCLVGGGELTSGGGESTRGIFLGGGGETNFQLVGGTPPPFPPVRKILKFGPMLWKNKETGISMDFFIFCMRYTFTSKKVVVI